MSEAAVQVVTPAPTTSIKIESSEGREFTVAPEVAKEFMLLGKQINEFKEGDAPIKFAKFDTAILSKVVLFCTYHATKEPMKKITMPLKSLEMKDNVQKWYADFIDGCDQPTLFQLITAGNDMGIAPLMTLASAKVAANMRKMPPAQMMQMLGMAAGAMPGAGGAAPPRF